MATATIETNGKSGGAAILRALYDKDDLKAVVAEGLKREKDGSLDGQGFVILGSAETRLSMHEDARRHLERAVELRPGHAGALNTLGIALDQLGRTEEAITKFERAIELKPDFPEVWNSLGVACRFQGDIDRAIECYRRSIELNPNQADAYRNLSVVHRFSAGDPAIEEMERLLKDARGDSHRAQICFALGKVRHDIGDTDEAFARWSEGNALRRAELGYRPEKDRALFAWILHAFSKPLPQIRDDAPVRPVFIVGLPRSGTTLAERIFSAHPDIHAAGEKEWLAQGAGPVVRSLVFDNRAPTEADIRRIREHYLTQAAKEAGGKPVVTDKLPINFRWIGFIAAALPEARIINMTRHPMAGLWSNFRHFFIGVGNAFAYDLGDLAHYYHLYQHLMARWSAHHGDMLLNIAYEGLVETPEPMVRHVLRHAGLPFHPACLEPHKAPGPARTASASQVQKKIYKGSSEEWRRYETHLEPLKAALAERNLDKFYSKQAA